jgi:hypothetical protein
MTTHQPPRIVATILGALGAEPDFRDAVIGDLAEEFAQRADRDGHERARRWYYREALRASPHLVSSSVRSRGFRGLTHRIGIAMSAYTITLVCMLISWVIVASVLRQAGASIPGITVPRTAPYQPANILFVALALTDLGMAVFAGFLAAYFDSEAPLLGATVLGTIWVGFGLVLRFVVASPAVPPNGAMLIPGWFFAIVLPAIGCGVITGGLLRVRQRARGETLIAGV